ncbi:uncharacterized protein [Physcomitrium patens]|uniref:uncharacterized protein n=1 Tax=Physcomitrium patens TaxID=3218 RepID=UPI003CCE26B5
MMVVMIPNFKSFEGREFKSQKKHKPKVPPNSKPRSSIIPPQPTHSTHLKKRHRTHNASQQTPRPQLPTLHGVTRCNRNQCRSALSPQCHNSSNNKGTPGHTSPSLFFFHLLLLLNMQPVLSERSWHRRRKAGTRFMHTSPSVRFPLQACGFRGCAGDGGLLLLLLPLCQEYGMVLASIIKQPIHGQSLQLMLETYESK